MEDKEMIKEMAKELKNDIKIPLYNYRCIATKLQPKGWVKLSEDSIVLTERQHEVAVKNGYNVGYDFGYEKGFEEATKTLSGKLIKIMHEKGDFNLREDLFKALEQMGFKLEE